MRYLVFALLLPAALPSQPVAQGACADVPKFFSRPPKIGEWAELSWQTKDKDEADRMRIAAVKEERREGKQMYWLQMVMNAKGKRTIMQMLTPWDVTAVA